MFYSETSFGANADEHNAHLVRFYGRLDSVYGSKMDPFIEIGSSEWQMTIESSLWQIDCWLDGYGLNK